MICPICNGDGGWIEPVLYNGIGGGPYEECNYCKRKGKVSLFKWLKYKYVVWRHK